MVIRDQGMEPEDFMDDDSGGARSSTDLTGIIDTTVGGSKTDIEDESTVQEDTGAVVSQFQWNVNRELGADPTDSDLAEVENEETDWDAETENLEVLDDPVRMYLREIGRVGLLKAQDEKDLARKIEGQKHLRKTRLALGQITIENSSPTVSTIKPGVIYDSKFNITGEQSWSVTKTFLNKIIMAQPLINALGEVLEIDDDDWIGGQEDDAIKIEEQNKVKTQESNEKTDIQKITRDQKVVESVEDTKNENEPKTIQDEEQTNKLENYTMDVDFLPNNGRYNHNVKQNILNKLPLDHLYIGLHIDSYHIATVAIEEKKGVKTLLCHDIFSKESQDFTYPNNFESLMDSFPEISDRLISQISKYGDIYKSAIEVLEKKATIALTIDNDEISTHIVTVPSQNAKEKNQIIEFSISKTINFSIDDAEVSHYKGNKELYYASVGSKNKLQMFGDYFFQNKWGIRKWYPVNQSIINAFLWNYPDRNRSSTLIIHIGEKNGSVLGFNKTDLTIIRPLYIGIATLFDTLRDNGLYDKKKEEQHRKLFQVPAPLLQTISKSIDKGEYDDIFRLVFEDWSQEIDRAINSMRKDLNISEETEILLAGSAGYIQYFDEFIQSETNIKTKFFNPIRNLAVAPEFSIESLGFNPSILTASIGSGINIKNAASILPKNLKQEENLRWINRGGIALAAMSLVFCIIFSINKKVNVEWLKFEIDPMQIERNSLGYVQDKHSQLSENKGNVEDQLKILSYDTRYSDRILAINRLLSFYTPKEIKISELSFQNGWSVEAYKKMGRDLVPIVKKEDEHLRIVKLAGSVYANPALLESHFNNFIAMLEETNIFQNIQIMNETSKANLGSDKLQFELKCVL